MAQTWGDQGNGPRAPQLGGQTPAPMNAPPTGALGYGVQPGTTTGVIIARIVEIFGSMSGLFVYNPTPGAGNLTESVAAVSGTDPYGNHFFSGFVVYGANSQKVALQTASGEAQIIFASGAASETQPGAALSFVQSLGLPAEQIELELQGPRTAVTPADSVNLTLFSSPNNAAGGAGGQLTYLQNPSTSFVAASWTKAGWNGFLVAQNVSTVPGSSPATAESWHNLSLATGFGAGTPTPQYQYEAQNGGRVRLRGQVTLTANAVAGKTIATLPAGYRAATTPQTFDGVNNLSGWSIGNGTFQAAASGVLTLTPTGTSGNVFWIDDNVIVLD